MELNSSVILGNVLAGAVAGVIAGTILAFSSYLVRALRDRTERKDQIQTLAALISDYENQVLSITEGIRVQFRDKLVHYNRDEYRKAKFDYLQREVYSLLEGRASQLSYDERHGVRRAFSVSELHPKAIFTDEQYRATFAQLQALEWLNLEYVDR